MILQLHIFTFENGAARELFADNWERPLTSGGYFHYYLFKMTDKPSLYYYIDDGNKTYGRFDIGADGMLVRTSLFSDVDPGSSSDGQHEYYKLGSVVSE